MANISGLRTRAYVKAALRPSLDVILDKTYLELLWAIRVINGHLLNTGAEEFEDAKNKLPGGGDRTCVDIVFLMEDLRLYDLGTQLGYFSPGADERLLRSIEERVLSADASDPYHLLNRLLLGRGDNYILFEMSPAAPERLTTEQFEDILPTVREIRTHAMRECVRLVFFGADDEWQSALEQVDWLIDVLGRDLVPTLSADQIDSLSWALSGADDYLEAQQLFPLLLNIPVGVHGPRWRELMTRRASLERLTIILAGRPASRSDNPYSETAGNAHQRANAVRDWPIRHRLTE